MFFLNLSFFEFMAIFTALSGVVVALYLLSRSRTRKSVPTLKFWVQAKQPVPSSHRRRVQQPWSLVLQLISLALLLLAIGQLKLGSKQTASRDHVLLLDSSSWMGAQSGDRMLIDEAKQKARAFLRSLPSSDRVMLVRVDALASPATGMESDHAVVEKAIDETRPGASALSLEQALVFARQIRQLHGSTAGEIVYVGGRRVAPSAVQTPQLDNLRVLAVQEPTENVGLAKIGARRSETDPELWEIFAAIRNLGSKPQRAPLVIHFGGAPAGTAVLQVAPGATENRTFQLRTRAAGWIEARILVKDALDDDNRAILELPPLKMLKVAVFTDDADAVRPALSALPQVEATYLPPSQYRADVPADVVVLDRFAPPAQPNVPSIWIEPPDSSPFRTRARIGELRAVRWRADHDVTAGIRTRSLDLENAQVFAPAKNDITLAEVAGGPVLLLRPAQRMAALGFHPGRADMRFDLTTPLLVANLLKWVQPETFRSSEIHGGSVGAVTTTIGRDVDASRIKVLADSRELPYTVHDGVVKFFAGAPGIIRVLAGDREQVHSLSLPDVGDRLWQLPSSARQGIPGMLSQAVSRDLWQVLAILGLTGLLVEWLIYGRRRVSKPPAVGNVADVSGQGSWRKAS